MVAHKDRATRLGCNDIQAILESSGRPSEVINATDTQDELIDDCVALMTARAARIDGRRSAQRKAQKIKACVQETYR